MKAHRAALILTSIVLLLAPIVAQAGNIDLINSQPMGTHWHQANTGSTYFWSDHLAAAAGNDYHAGTVTGGNVRTPEGYSSTFAGDSLSVYPGAQLLLKTNNDSRVYTVADFRMDGGAITHGSDNRTITFRGTTTVLTDSRISNAGKNARRLYFDADLVGSGDLLVQQGDADWMWLRGDGSAYSGDWDIVFAPYTGSPADNGSPTPWFHAAGTNSLGSGSIHVGDNVIFDIDYDLESRAAEFTLEGALVLDQDHLFGGLTIGGTTLPAGDYSFEQLNTAFDPYIRDGGTGSITVVPEPCTLALLAAGLLALRRRRR